MPSCRKCSRDLPDGASFCPWCGTKQNASTKRKRVRANGTGTIFKRGKYYYAQQTAGKKVVNNRVQYIRITKGGFRTKAEAAAYLSAADNDGISSRLKNATFSTIYTQMMERHTERVSNDTLNCYRSAYLYYKPVYAMKFRGLVTADLQACIDNCPHGKRTKENMKALGTLMYKYAQEQKIVTENFAQFIWIPRENKKEDFYPAFPENVMKVLENACKQGDRSAMMIYAACFLGFRPSALIRIRLEDYDRKNQTLTGGVKTNAGKERIVPISSRIKSYVKILADSSESGFIFSDGKKPYSEKTFREKLFYPEMAKLGIQPIPTDDVKPIYMPYCCRVTFATMMKNVSGSDKDKAALMGHTSFEMTLHYQREDLESKMRIIEQLSLTANT